MTMVFNLPLSGGTATSSLINFGLEASSESGSITGLAGLGLVHLLASPNPSLLGFRPDMVLGILNTKIIMIVIINNRHFYFCYSEFFFLVLGD